MIKKLSIRNFQSHEKTDLVFVPGVNVITGKSNSGKTAIIRALNWLVSNRPRGFRFHSEFAGDESTEVSLMVNESTISLEKDEKQSRYMIDGKEFSGMAGAVPDQIEKILNISEINFSRQLDAPFLITDSAGEVGRVINRITKLEKVDSWISNITTDVNSTNKNIEVKKEFLNKTEQDLQERKEILDDLLPEYEWLKSNIEQYNVVEYEVIKLQEIVIQAVDVESHVKELSLWLEVEGEVKLLENLVGDYLKASEVFGLITEVIGILDKISQLPDLDLNELNEVDGLVSSWKDIKKNIMDLEFLIEGIQETTRRVIAADNYYQIQLLKLNEFLKEFSTCPLCGQTISEEKKKEILGEQTE